MEDAACNDASPSVDNWTDALKVCSLSGIGTSTNEIYREDGTRVEAHKFEDKSFRFCPDGQRYLYGIVDGHDGDRVSQFVYQRLPAELLLGQLSSCSSDSEIQETLHQAFLCVDEAYMQSIQEILAEKAEVQEQIPPNWNQYEIYRNSPQLADRLKVINQEIGSGATAVITLVDGDGLYVANVGDCRALLCKTDEEGNLRVLQLTIDHTLHNEDELLRLEELGLPSDMLRKGGKIGNQKATRELGDYSVKGGYKEIDELKNATAEPVTAEPEINCDVKMDSNCRFLMLASSGLVQTLEDVISPDESVNRKLASLVARQFYHELTMVGVAQAVIDQVRRLHHDKYMMRSREQNLWCSQRDDMTLLVRNFNYPLGGSYQTTIVPLQPPDPTSATSCDTLTGGGQTTTTTSGSSGTSTGTDLQSVFKSFRSHVPLTLDSEGRVEPYVDFTDFYQALAEAGAAGDLIEEESEGESGDDDDDDDDDDDELLKRETEDTQKTVESKS